MTALSVSDEVERFREVIADRLGLQFEDAKLGFLAELLKRRLRGQQSEANYLDRLAALAPREELGELALELTVPETYFFRNIEQFRALAEVALPDLLRRTGAGAPLRILSAGCASGEEPYTIAMIGRGILREPAALEVHGIDINAAMLDKAARGRYSEWALRETPPEMRNKWFRRSGGESVLDETIRAAVQFMQRNLVEEDVEFWATASWEVVFCRNVLMYLTPQKAAAVLARISRALVPGGYLFLGHAENLRGLSQDFCLRHTHGTFYYQRREGGTQAIAITDARSEVGELAGVLAAAGGEGDSWMEIIRKASDRVHVLTQDAAASGGGAAPHRTPAWNAELALELLRQERYADALELVQTPPTQGVRGSEELLLAAVLLTHAGRLEEAEGTCRSLLEADGLNVGAHYVLALCREGTGDRRGAVEHDQIAAYLDPAFAMPHLHLGLLARRVGDHAGARRELAQAMVLLQREDAPRLLLFGGGFGRDALLGLAAAELAACGGGP